MLSNQQFLTIIQTSFKEFIKSKTSRSTSKLKPLHGAIANDIATRLGTGYKVWAQGYADDKERKIAGRYIDKMVDITIENVETKKVMAGIAVKFVMQNYSQNSNNYFENMLGETANIRAANYPYFQIFIILDTLPYYQNSGRISKWEEFTDHNMQKYCELSKDSINTFFHTPNKTLIYVVNVTPDACSNNITSKTEYMEFYENNFNNIKISTSKHYYAKFSTRTVILNDYKLFVDKVYHTIMSM